ncbi:hypothetical protein J3492_12540 [Psychrobacter sp. F1192]|uniref:Type II/III secretion system secretin-like domain-containing protein n=1 Tax=Psychrobacter coccoides TaxID=2818440 RepID=A0ABS3NRI2_9GAMM|nr:hypothetical protein [Psychrobacter coccoides]MBO1532027.1 hypothetical protein [Psychrobacter coccoides]
MSVKQRQIRSKNRSSCGLAMAYMRHAMLVLSLGVLSIGAQAATSQTYVIHTYGGEALLPAVRQQLDSSQGGGSVSIYQDKLILQTTQANYQAVQQLLQQIDGQPQALTVAVRVGNDSNIQSSAQQSRVVISNRGIAGAGVSSQRNSQQQSNSTYQVQTLSGSAASISTGTLYSLTQSYQVNGYPTYHRPSAQITIQQQVLLPTVQGITVTPRLLPNGQVEVQLSQAEERLVSVDSHYRQSNAIRGQRLNSTITVPRGQWVDIGHISQSTQHNTSSYGGSSVYSSNKNTPIWLLVQ